ncbi:MAG: hypothetical protein P4M05_19630, partial [Bradyrhizobium sp.]|nr:hypothetical protein [Bradyrhizobium sp.]
MKKLIGILALIAMMSGGESLRAQVIAPGHVEGNGTSSARTPTDTALSAILDQAIGSAQGTIAVRGASGWNSLTPGTSGTYLKSNGAGANLSWGAISGSGTVTSIATTSPITGGPITTTGTIGCATCGVTGSPLSQFASTTSAQLAGIISDGTGSGSLVFGTSPSLTTPSLGVATATSINKVAITAPATSATLTIANGKTLTDTSGVGADLLLGATGGGFAAYSGASCTSQVLSGLSATGAANSCVSITNAYLTTGTFASITGTGTLTAGATGAGFTIALGTSTI